MDEATEEETYSTQLRLHDRETSCSQIREAWRGSMAEIDECGVNERRLQAPPAEPVTTLCSNARPPERSRPTKGPRVTLGGHEDDEQFPGVALCSSRPSGSATLHDHRHSECGWQRSPRPSR